VGALLVRVTVADLGGGGRDDDAVHYDAADSKSAAEKEQARKNIGIIEGGSTVDTTNGNYFNVPRPTNHIIFENTSITDIHGFDKGVDGELLLIQNKGTSRVRFRNQSVNASADNRLSLLFDFSELEIDNSVFFIYKVSAMRWFAFGLSGMEMINSGTRIRKSLAIGPTTAIPAALPTLVLQAFTNFNDRRVLDAYNNSFSSIFYVRNDGRVYANMSDDTGAAGFGHSFRGYNAGPTTDQFVVLDSSSNECLRVFGGTTGGIRHVRSDGATKSVRRDELPFNYPETVTTSGTINDLSLANEGVKLLILTLADDLTGVVPVTTNTGRLLRIEGRNATGVIIRHDSASSTAANRFSIGADLTIANGEIYTFIYTNARWRRVL
jgi:hypothetical protein